MSDTKVPFDDDALSVIATVCKITKYPMEAVSRLFFQFRSNNFGVTDDLLSCVAVGVYPHAALLNHSCSPNCVLRYVLTDKGPILQVVALRRIESGEELCHSYTDCVSPARLRQRSLLSTYGFICSCALCRPPAGSSACSESFRVAFRRSGAAAPLDIRDFIDGYCAQHPLFVRHLNSMDEFSTALLFSEESYEAALSVTHNLCHEADLVDWEESSDGCTPRHLEILERAVALLARECGPFHQELYRLRGKLMTALLLCGRNAEALVQCELVVSCLCVALSHLPHHPLLGLQLFTLGDLSVACGRSEVAVRRIYLWAESILSVSHGAQSSIYQRLDDIIGNRS